MRSLPPHTELVEELRGLRRPGLPRLRHCTRDALRRTAEAAGLCAGEDDELEGVERLLAAAARRLAGGGPLRDERDGDPLARAAAHTFGLFTDRRGVPAADRRKAAAAVYGVSTERFRRSHESEIFAELASAALAVAREAADPDGTGEPAPDGRRPPVTDSGAPPPDPPSGPPVPPHVAARISVRTCPIELVRDADILVSPENVYLEMSKIFRPTVSAALRRSAAVRNAAGEIVDDVLPRELRTWLRAHGRPGLPVRPGTVVPTSPGALGAHGVRRIHHAAVSTPVGDGDRYHVAPAVLAEAVQASFALARSERAALSLPMTTLCFPLLGAGRGGLPVVTAARWLLWAVRRELREDTTWSVIIVTTRPQHTDAVRAANSHP
ncbi:MULTISPECIES: macro domain-containing protein [unclassified Streptomyces]|uniref:macro domain-containing protein n=1 Tax=unclassified Streptomyces TaxID=2593676 RepID=UPI002237CB98|nr:Appr-1-p processing protein [Streptomyces sp. SHP 1-2]MCW5254306.1 Appr-1-p processing protein [Streptomyces sp. SHP 1-2]